MDAAVSSQYPRAWLTLGVSGKTVDMRPASMLPLKGELVVGGTKDSAIEGIDEL